MRLKQAIGGLVHSVLGSTRGRLPDGVTLTLTTYVIDDETGIEGTVAISGIRSLPKRVPKPDVQKLFADLPLPNMRPMTADEITDYEARQDAGQ